MGDWSVNEKIVGRLPITLELGLMSIVIGLVIALPVGIYSAVRQDTAVDYVGRSVAILGLATPNFWLGIMVMVYSVIWWGWSPPMRLITFSEDPLGKSGDVPHSESDSGDLPCRHHHAHDTHHDAGGAQAGLHPHRLVQGSQGAGGCRETRRQECLHPDRDAFSWAYWPRCGRPASLRPAGADPGGCSVIMENIFNLPGLGRLLLDALNDRDYPVVSGINLFFGTAVMVINLLIDLIYAFLDPRVRYE